MTWSSTNGTCGIKQRSSMTQMLAAIIRHQPQRGSGLQPRVAAERLPWDHRDVVDHAPPVVPINPSGVAAKDGGPPRLDRDRRCVGTTGSVEHPVHKRVRERPGIPASPSPSSRWGRFPIFTGVRVSHRATPTKVAPFRGITRRASPRASRYVQNSSKVNKPNLRRKNPPRSFRLSL